jgi:hypothetical protein
MPSHYTKLSLLPRKVPISVLLFGDNRFNTIKTLYKAYNNKVLNLENLKVFNYIIFNFIKGQTSKAL